MQILLILILIASLFKQTLIDGKPFFIEDSNYLMNIEGEPSGSFYENVGDLNGDGLLILSLEH